MEVIPTPVPRSVSIHPAHIQMAGRLGSPATSSSTLESWLILQGDMDKSGLVTDIATFDCTNSCLDRRSRGVLEDSTHRSMRWLVWRTSARRRSRFTRSRAFRPRSRFRVSPKRTLRRAWGAPLMLVSTSASQSVPFNSTTSRFVLIHGLTTYAFKPVLF